MGSSAGQASTTNRIDNVTVLDDQQITDDVDFETQISQWMSDADTIWDSSNATFNRRTRDAGSMNKIIFDVPDLIVSHSVNGIDVELHAYKVRDRNNHWVSIGWPYFLKSSTGSIYKFKAKKIVMQLRLLAKDQVEALKNTAKDFYPNVDKAFITLIPLQSVSCRTTFAAAGDTIELQGQAYNLNQYAIEVEVPLVGNSRNRRAFFERINQSDSLDWKCTFMAGGKESFVNELSISGQDLHDTAIHHDLFGPANQVYVTRKQLTLFAQIVRTNVLIEENYEFDEKIDEKIVDRLLFVASSTFEFVPIDRALEKLSKFGFSMSDRDLEPDEIKRKLADTMVVERRGNKQALSLKSDKKQTSEYDDQDDVRFGAKLSIPVWFDLEANGEVLKKKSRKSNFENMSAKDKMDEMNKDDQISVKFEVEGSKIEPKSVKVAVLHGNSFKRDISIIYKKKILKDSLYKKEIAINMESFVEDSRLVDLLAQSNKDQLEAKQCSAEIMKIKQTIRNFSNSATSEERNNRKIDELIIKSQTMDARLKKQEAKLHLKFDGLECSTYVQPLRINCGGCKEHFNWTSCETILGSDSFLQKVVLSKESVGEVASYTCCKNRFIYV